ncbi:DNA-directed RNA polymerase subunit beta [Bienertia sinuspersici]
MTGQIVIRSSVTATNRRQPLLKGSLTPSPNKRSSNVGEVAGKTTANCFLVCCCCPCVVIEFVILAVYRVPASICRRIWRKRSSKMKIKRRKKIGFLEEIESGGSSEVYYKTGVWVDESRDFDQSMLEIIRVSFDDERSTVDLDMKMWDQFNSAGFWRSSS